MKRAPLSIAASLLLVSTIVIPKPRTFTGEIMDSQCARMGTHGIGNLLETSKDCTIQCVKLGGQYVLYDPAMRMAYGLDDQVRPEAFAGGRVEVVGTLEQRTSTIHVLEIRSLENKNALGR